MYCGCIRTGVIGPTVALKPSITQVVDLLEGLRCLPPALLCERIIEVPTRDWLVAPAVHKDGSYCIRKAPMLDEEQREEDETSDETDKGDFMRCGITNPLIFLTNKCFDPCYYIPEEMTTQNHPAFGSIPYIARPNPQQMSHTGQWLFNF